MFPQLIVRISGDGRNSSNKCNFVMITMTILIQDASVNSNYFNPDDCLSLAIYEGVEERSKVNLFFHYNLLF